jgi:hypothetical protein|tara:strand:- start:139 stop:423 length:285 start_codon:yes stop_codon:yes gene_type:complete
MKYKINVDEEDINNGIPGNCNACAISQALRRKFNTNAVYTEIDGGDVVLTIDEKKFQVNDMQESDVIDFIFDFDQDDGWSDVKPITFEIIERSA